jgi:hypothetical protein
MGGALTERDEFVDGGDRDGATDRIAAMDQYVGDKKPMIRLDLFWNDVQPTRDATPDFRAFDARVDAAYGQGVRVLLILDY